MDLIHNGGGGGGVSDWIHFSTYFLTFNVKIMSKNWKITIKQWWEEKNIVHIWGGGGGFGWVGLNPSKCFFFLFFFNFPYSVFFYARTLFETIFEN